MKRLLPVALLAVFAVAVFWILNSGESTPSNTTVPDKPTVSDPVLEDVSLESGPQRTSSEIKEVVFDPRASKIGAGNFGLHGTVVDERGSPIGGLWVAAYSIAFPLLDFEFSPEEIFENPLDLKLEPLAATWAEEDGSFLLEGLPGRGLFLVARGKHHLTRGRQAVQADELTSEDGILLHTIPGAVLNGRVIDEFGAPVANAEVFVGPSYLYIIQAVRNRDIYLERIFTDGNGHFSIDAVPANARLMIAAMDRATHPGMLDIGPLAPGSTVEATVQLADTGSLSGRTVDSEGNGVAGTKIVAIPLDLRMLVGFVRSLPDWMTESGSDGSFNFAQLPRRTVVLLAQGRDGRSAPYTAQVSAAQNEMAESIEIQTTQEVSGRIVGIDGRGVAGAKVFLSAIPEKDGGKSEDIRGMMPSGENLLIEAARGILPELLPSETWTYTDNSGRFQLPAWNNAKLKVEASGYSEAYFELPGSLEEEQQLALILLKPGAVSGSVVDSQTKQAIALFGVTATLQNGLLEPDIESDFLEDESWTEYSKRIETLKKEARQKALGGTLAENEIAVLPVGSPMETLRNVAFNDDGTGKFEIDGLMPGTWRLETRAGGYMLGRNNQITVVSEQTTEGIQVELSKGATLKGQVVAYGSHREPIAGAMVTIGWSKESGIESYFSMGLESMAFARSGKDGSFELSGIEPGMEWVHVVAEGFSPTAIKGRPLEADEVRDGVVIQVRQGATIQGFVFDRHNQILPGRMVGGFSTNSQDFWQTSTNEDGFYQVKHVKPGTYFVLTAALNADKLFQGDFMSVLNGSKVLQAFVKEGETLDLDIVDMSANGCRLRGKLLSEGTPVANAMMFIMATDAGANMFDVRVATASSNAEGEFEFISLAPGDYRLQIEAELWSGAIEVQVPDAEDDYQVLNTPQGRVYGRIVEELSGNAVANATVKLVRDDSSGGIMAMFTGGKETDFTQSDDSGQFEFLGKAPGRYHVEVEINEWGGNAESSGGEPLGKAVVKTFTLTQDSSYSVGDVLLPIAAAIRVHVTLASGKDIQRGYNLRAVPVDSEGENGSDSTETWGWGPSSLISGVKPGAYDVIVSGRGYINVRIENVFVDHAQTVDIDVVLEEGLALNARVLGPNSQPIAGADVRVLDSMGNRVDGLDGAAGQISAMFSSEDGTMPLGSFAPGSYIVRVEWQDEVQERSVSLTEGEVTVAEFQF